MSHRFKVSSLSLFVLITVGCADDGAHADSTGGSTTSTVTGEAPTSGTSTGEPPATSTGEPGSGGSDSGEPAPDLGGGEDPCADSVLTWENFGEPFALSWCTGCHHAALPTAERAGAPCGVNLDSHAGASQFAARLHVRVIDWSLTPGLTPMPPAAIVPEAELALLREWLDCGAPGPQTGEPAPSCPDP